MSNSAGANSSAVNVRFPWRALIIIAVASFAACAIVDLTYFAGHAVISLDEERLLNLCYGR